MKKLLTFSFFLLTFSFALSAHAAFTNWAMLDTVAASGDTSEGGNFAQYTAYCITSTAAATLFGSADLASASDYIKANSAAVKSGLATSGIALASDGYDHAQYGFQSYSETSFAGDYWAVVFYDAGDETQYRVFGATTAAANGSGSMLVFDDQDAASGTVTGWTTAVPEPTSGLLLLVGCALLALRRRRA